MPCGMQPYPYPYYPFPVQQVPWGAPPMSQASQQEILQQLLAAMTMSHPPQVAAQEAGCQTSRSPSPRDGPEAVTLQALTENVLTRDAEEDLSTGNADEHDATQPPVQVETLEAAAAVISHDEALEMKMTVMQEQIRQRDSQLQEVTRQVMSMSHDIEESRNREAARRALENARQQQPAIVVVRESTSDDPQDKISHELSTLISRGLSKINRELKLDVSAATGGKDAPPPPTAKTVVDSDATFSSEVASRLDSLGW